MGESTGMSGEEMVALSKRYTLFDWQAQANANPIPVERLAEWMCAAPARLAGVDARKGSIEPGKDADLVIWDPEAEFDVDESRLRQRHKQTPYAGRRLRGRVITTYARGRVVYGDSGAPREPIYE